MVRASSLLFFVAILVVGASAAASETGVGVGVDTAYLPTFYGYDPYGDVETSMLAPGFSLTARHAFVARESRSFLAFDLTGAWVRYEAVDPELMIRARSMWGWRFATALPLDLSAGLGLWSYPRNQIDNEAERRTRWNGMALVPTVAVGTGFMGDGWEINLTARLEAIHPSAQVSILFW